MRDKLIQNQKYTIFLDEEPLYLQYLRPYKEKFAFKNLFNEDIVLLNEVDIQLLNRRNKKSTNEIFTVQSDILECVVSRQEIQENYESFDKSAVFINIYTPGQKPLDLNSYFYDQLSIAFYDISLDIGESITGSVKPISNEVAKKIKEFILKNKNRKFAINCDAGISRSAGIAMAIECILKFNESKYNYSTSYSELKNFLRYKANLYVYDKIIGA